MARQLEIRCKGRGKAEVRLTDGTVLPDVVGVDVRIRTGEPTIATVYFLNARVIAQAEEVAAPALEQAEPGLLGRLLKRFRS